jgi:hypothetical protein
MYFAHWLNIHLTELSSAASQLQTVHLPNAGPGTHRFTETHARWMFALLSKVEDYCSPDEMSHMRNLARACMRLVKERRKETAPLLPTSAPLSEPTSNLPLDSDVTMNPAAASELTKMRRKNNQNMGEQSCWMVIAAIAGVWAQRDLWMDAKEILVQS